jgi:zinc-ribbon domain/Sel1 repeat
LLCSNCGYENPSEHRYCGMCGTPFPHRALTVPGAQSTLSFTSSPVEVPPEAVPEPIRAATIEPEPVAPEPVAGPALEVEPVERPAVGAPTPAPKEPLAAAIESTAGQEPVAEIQDALPATPEQDAAAVVPVEPEAAEAPPPVGEPGPTAELERVEAEPEAAEEVAESTPESEPAPQMPPVPEPPAPKVTPEAPAQRPASPRVLVMPAPQAAEPVPAEVSAQNLAKVHPPPDSLPLSSPPASSGMPTFKEISEASGPPVISPFEPPKESHTAEDRELEDFVANFQWSPPAETADELTMRSEVPVIDDQPPEEFHHPSFDGDVAPPPEAGPHPTGKEYYAADGTAARPHFLDVGERPPGDSRRPEISGSSILGIDATPAINPPAALAKASRRRGWLWGSIIAVVAIFGGLGYLEGRAQSTHAFRGPLEIVREGYGEARQWLREKVEPATAAPQNGAPETAKPAEPQAQAGTPAQPVNSQAENAQQNPAATSPADGGAPAKESPPAGGTQSANAAPEPADTAPPKPIEAPLPKPSSKPQPGQQELAKALNASDPAATAAWLWKATSRGNSDAPVRLADMYIKGNGVPKSCEQALVLLRSAATNENAPARNRLAALYANGTCVSRDPVKAYQLMTSALAADPNSDWARENRQRLWNHMTPEQRAEAEKAH